MASKKVAIGTPVIEDIPVNQRESLRGKTAILAALLRDMEVGQSVMWGKADANHRLVIAAVQVALNRKFAVVNDNGQQRIGRVE